MRLTPSCDTRGLDGKRNDWRQLRIFCLVTCRCVTYIHTYTHKRVEKMNEMERGYSLIQ